MPVRIQCPYCQQVLRLPDKLYRVPAECPRCNGAFEVRWRQSPVLDEVQDVLPVSAAEQAGRQPCPLCGKLIRPEAVKCPFCRGWLEDSPCPPPGGGASPPPLPKGRLEL